MIIAILTKDPNGILDYTASWTPYLAAGRTITSAELIVPSGITAVSDTPSANAHSFRLADGVDGTDYEVITAVTLDNGQKDRRSIIIQVRQTQPVVAADAVDHAAALSQLLLWIQKDVVPPLTPDDIVRILNGHKVATTWAPDTFYPVGTRILPPSPRPGVWYQVVRPGISQSNPRPFNEWPIYYGAIFGDGNSDPQLWLEVQGEDSIFRTNPSDPSSVNCYDVRGAARECIQTRLQLGVELFDQGEFSFDQITTHLKGLLERFYPIRFPISVVRG